jgi:hypothetical protein
LSSRVEPLAVAIGEVVVASSAEFEFADSGGPDAEGCGGVGEGDVLGLPCGSQVGVVGDGAVADEGLEDLAGDGAFECSVDGWGALRFPEWGPL